MEIYQYLPIKDNFKIPITKKTEHESWTPFLRQLLVLSGAWTGLFISGLGMGATTVLIAQWRKETKPDAIITEEMSTWLTSGGFYSAPIWALLWMAVTKQIGRKIPYAISTTIMLISFIIFYFSTTVKHLLICEVLKGAGYATNLSVTVLIFTEYSSPKYRGVFLTLKAASVYWGIWVANAIGTFCHWKYIAVAAFVCFVHAATMVFWPESPLWLATKGRYDKCAKTHRWLKGTDETSERELENLIATQKEYLKSTPIKSSLLKQIGDLFISISKRHFYKPLLISMIISQQMVLSGKLSSSLYAVQLMKKMTKDESNAYTTMLVLDGITVIGMYAGCIVARYVKRRNLAISTSILTVFFLYTISLYFYLDHLEIIVANDIIVACLLTAYSVSMACGPLILTYTLYGEMIPTESRTMYTLITVMLNFFLSATYLKTAPYVFNRLSMQATFLFYGVSASVITVCLYYFMPETKDKTLAEIEDSFRKPNSTNLQKNRKLDLLNSVE